MIVAGWLCVGLGVAGMALPVLPTTPFILLASWLFYRSSPRAKKWLDKQPVLGAIIRNYEGKKGIPLHAKVITLVVMWLSIGLSIYFVHERLWLVILLLVISVAVTIHISRYKTL